MRTIPLVLGLGCWAAALCCGSGSGAGAASFANAASAVTRPFVLPFLWRGWRDAAAQGTDDEQFGRSRALMTWMPQWYDGYIAFSWTHAGGSKPLPAAERLRRVLAAVAWLNTAAEAATTRDSRIELVLGTGYLVEFIGERHPDVAALLADPAQGLGLHPRAFSDRCQAAAEQLGASREVRENRAFHQPKLIAALLQAGQREAAAAACAFALERSTQLADQQHAAEWRENLLLVQRALAGEPGLDLAPLAADPRFAALVPLLGR